MTLTHQHTIRACCDRCGHGEYVPAVFHGRSEAEALDNLRASGWRIVDGEVVCYHCTTLPREWVKIVLSGAVHLLAQHEDRDPVQIGVECVVIPGIEVRSCRGTVLLTEPDGTATSLWLPEEITVQQSYWYAGEQGALPCTFRLHIPTRLVVR